MGVYNKKVHFFRYPVQYTRRENLEEDSWQAIVFSTLLSCQTRPSVAWESWELTVHYRSHRCVTWTGNKMHCKLTLGPQFLVLAQQLSYHKIATAWIEEQILLETSPRSELYIHTRIPRGLWRRRATSKM